MSKKNPAGAFLLFASIALVVCGILFGYTQVIGPLPFNIEIPSGPKPKARLITDGQQDFVDHVNRGLSAAKLHIQDRSYNLKNLETAHLINQVYLMDVRTDLGLRARDIPEAVHAEQEGAVICWLEFIASKSPDRFKILVYKSPSGEYLAAIKKEKHMAGQVYDGQYKLNALSGSLRTMTGGKCG